MNHEQDARALDQSLTSGECHDPSLKPLQDMAEVLKREASRHDAELDSGVAKTQRATLMTMAEKQAESPKSEGSTISPNKDWKVRLLGSKFWVPLAGAGVVVAAVVLLLVSQKQAPSSFTTAEPAQQVISRLLIPRAHAADAFTLVAENQDAAGVDTTTTFLVTSRIPVTSAQLTQHLRIVPPPDAVAATPTAIQITDVEDLGDGRFRVRAGEPLHQGAVYRIALAAAVEQEDGSLQARDFSWAVQTKSIFRVISSVPGPDTSTVPVNTGIEFFMSLPGWEDPAPFFSITPKVEGAFQARGRSLVFVPKTPLQPGQIYTITLRQGFKVAGSDRALEKDVVVRFETERTPVATNGSKVLRLFSYTDVVVTAPVRETEFPVYWDATHGVAEVKLTGYALRQEEAKAVLLERAAIPEFAIETQRRGEIFARAAKQKAFEVDGRLAYEDYRTTLRIPQHIAAGWYIVKIEPKDGEPTWMYLESTNVATYTTSDKNTTLIWVMNVDSRRPMDNLPVSYGNVQARTDRDGVVRIPTPAIVNSTSTSGAEIVTVGEGATVALLTLNNQSTRYYWSDWSNGSSVDTTVSYFYADRPLYRTTDTAQLFGMAQDRASQRPAERLTMDLERSGIFDWFAPSQEKVYRHLELTPDEAGFFRAAFDWKDLAPGYYTLSLKRDGIQIASRSIEIRDFVKPAYSIEVTTAKQQVYAGDVVEGEVRATFYNGAPMAGLPLELYVSGVESRVQNVQTDESGRATFRIPTKATPCDLSRSTVSCSHSNSLTIQASPQNGEEAFIFDTAWVTVWRSRIVLDADVETKNDQAMISFLARRVNLDKVSGDGQVIGEPARSTKVSGRIIELRWERTEDGTTYDYLEKRVVPRYRYELKEREVAKVDVATDAEGRATMPFAMSPDTSLWYRVIVSALDEKGAQTVGQAGFAKGWWSISNYRYDRGITLEPTVSDEKLSRYHVNERISLSFFNNNVLLPEADPPSYLFVEAHLGIQDSAVSKRPTYEFTFTEQDVPNMKVRGVIFKNGTFVEREFDLGLDTADRELSVRLLPDQSAYAPGAKAKIRAQVFSQGAPVQGARVAIGAVDEAVYAAAQMSEAEEYPLNALYAWVSDGIIATKISHENLGEGFNDRGAEMGGGGGGGEAVRRNFKDTAAFQVLTTDASGQGEIEMTLPDNLTSWRLTAVAMTQNVYAGSGKANIAVTKPVFVDVVAPQTVLTQDKPVIKLRAYGVGLSTNEPVTFSVDAPSLGLKEEKVQGVANSSTFIAVDTLPEGNHALIIRVASSRGSDALEKHLKVVSSRFMRDELIQTDLVPGATLPAAGMSREVEVQFLPKTRAQYVSRVRSLSQTWSARVESKIAAQIAQGLLKTQFNHTDLPDSESLVAYQKPSGGIAILPYASEDPELTSKVASVAPDLFDRTLMAKYLWEMALRKDVAREEQARAISGLAALHEPVLTQLHSLAVISDLTWREQLAIMRGLHAAGDGEAARQMLDRLLQSAEEHDGKRSIRILNDKRSSVEATAEAAAVAAALAHPSATQLDAWLESNWAEDALTDLDRIAYLARVVPAAIGSDVTIRYSIGDAEQTIELQDGAAESVIFTAEELRNFRVTQSSGPAVAVFTRQVANVPLQSPDLSVKRGYIKQEYADTTSTQIFERDAIVVGLDVEWKQNAPNGCYVLRDHVPAGLAPLVNVWFDPYGGADTWYAADVEDNVVSFIVCNQHPRSVRVSYRARVISRGSYVFEPAVLQSMDMPSVAAVSRYDTITIK